MSKIPFAKRLWFSFSLFTLTIAVLVSVLRADDNWGVPVRVTAGSATPSVVTVGETVQVSADGEFSGQPSPHQETKRGNESWTWGLSVQIASSKSGSYTVASSSDYEITSSPGNSSNATYGVKLKTAAYFKFTISGTGSIVALRESDGQPEGHSWSGSNTSPAMSATAVGISKLQYKIGNSEFIDVPNPIGMLKDEQISIKAIPTPSDASFPSGKPEWGGTANLSGSSDTASGTLSDVSTSDQDFKTVTAKCGNTVSANIIVAELTFDGRMKNTGDYSTSDVTIAAGALGSDVHQAEIRVNVSPAVSIKGEIRLSLSDGGAGYTSSSWYWGVTATPAKLVNGTRVYTFGDSQPLTFSTVGGIYCTLSSSNKAESTKVKLEIPSRNISKDLTVKFSAPDIKVDLGNQSANIGVWTPYTVTATVGSKPVDGHSMKLVVTKVNLKDGTVVNPDLEDSSSSSTSLVAYVQVDPNAWYDHTYEADTTAMNTPSISTQFKVVDPNVAGFEITAYDFSVADPGAQ